MSNIVPSDSNSSSLGRPRSSQSVGVQAFGGKVKAGYRIETHENGYKEQIVANIGGEDGVTLQYENTQYIS
jgi:hypothetical protein